MVDLEVARECGNSLPAAAHRGGGCSGMGRNSRSRWAKQQSARREALVPPKSKSMLLADRGYDADWIRILVRQHGA